LRSDLRPEGPPAPSARPALSVVIAWCNRPELAVTLRHNRRAFHDARCEVLVVNCGGDAALLRRLLVEAPVEELRRVELPAPAFNKPLALNLGAAAARAARLFLLDADVLLTPRTIGQALRRLGGGCYVTIDRVREAPTGSLRPPARRVPPAATAPAGGIREIANSLELVGAGGRRARIDLNRVRLDDGTRSAPGLVLLARDHFLAVEGMSSDLEGWGWEDMDLLFRLELGLGLRRRRTGRATHLSHGDELRSLGEGGRFASEQANQALCLARYRAGDYLGSYRDDLARWGDPVAAAAADGEAAAP
jgi:N-terminal domain of galactosyltransferase